MSYKPLEVKWTNIAGFEESMRAMRLPKGTKSDSKRTHGKFVLRAGGRFILGKSDAALAARLIKAGNDHAKAIRSIIVWVELTMQVGWMIEFETYRIGVECLSTSSSMHGELRDLAGPELAEKKQADLPEKVYTRCCIMSYQVLRNIYRARRRHRHPDWQIFCQFIERLPFFEQLIYPEASKDRE